MTDFNKIENFYLANNVNNIDLDEDFSYSEGIKCKL